MPSAVIVDAARTASGRGRPGGALAHWHPVDLLGTVLAALVERTDIDPAFVDDVIVGCVTAVGTQSVNLARSAALAAGFPQSVPGTTVDRQCGSSQQALAFAAQAIVAGDADVVLAGGVELMSAHPINEATLGADHWGPLVHHRYPEGLVDQGIAAELIAHRWGFSREVLEEFAFASHARAAAADFSAEILPVAGPAGPHAVDETIRATTSAEGLAALAPVFRTDEAAARFPELDWRITAGTSSPYTDGASAVLVMSDGRAAELGLTPRARIVASTVVGSDPIEMLTGVIPATERILARTGLGLDDLDAIEVNEAFASVPLAWLAEFPVDPARLNPRGGAIALGHALGSSGTRLVTSLLHHLEATSGRFGLQVMCERGGMANATIVERL